MFIICIEPNFPVGMACEARSGLKPCYEQLKFNIFVSLGWPVKPVRD